MAVPIHIAPPVVSAGFRDFDDRRIAADDRRRRHRRVGGRGKTKSQTRAQDKCSNHVILTFSV
jgi:hypothetical protein